jgi:homocysteine S-methyltransferase
MGLWLNSSMNRFRQRLADPRPILLDGAMGTELEHRGVDTSTPIWSALALLEAPRLIEQIHREYLEAGAEIITTNTFRTHRRNLERVGMGEEAGRLTALAVAIAQAAVRSYRVENAKRSPNPAEGRVAFVAGGISPLEDSYTMAPLPRRVYLHEHAEMAGNLAAAGVDLLLLETMKEIAESEAAAEAAAGTKLPFGVSFICKLDGRLFSGESLAEAVRAIEPHGPVFVGVNCTAAPSIGVALAELRAATKLPISVYANPSHTEDYQHWGESEAAEPATYARLAVEWLQGGAHLVGGCCGTTPEHIAHLAALQNVEA